MRARYIRLLRILDSRLYNLLLTGQPMRFSRLDDEAMIRAAEKNGFRIEGHIRQTVYFNGKFHDGVLMGVLREEFEVTKSAWTDSRALTP